MIVSNIITINCVINKCFSCKIYDNTKNIILITHIPCVCKLYTI